MDTLTLYHGTDARLIEMSAEERADYFAAVDVVIDSLWPHLEPYDETIPRILYFPDGTLKGTSVWRRIESLKQQFIDSGESELYHKLSDVLQKLFSWKKGSELYQYDSFYVGSSRMKVIQYAMDSFAGGEHGSFAYYLIKGVEFLKPSAWKPSLEVADSIRRVLDFSEGEKRQPVIVTIENKERGKVLNSERVCLDFYQRMKYRPFWIEITDDFPQ